MSVKTAWAGKCLRYDHKLSSNTYRTPRWANRTPHSKHTRCLFLPLPCSIVCFARNLRYIQNTDGCVPFLVYMCCFMRFITVFISECLSKLMRGVCYRLKEAPFFLPIYFQNDRSPQPKQSSGRFILVSCNTYYRLFGVVKNVYNRVRSLFGFPAKYKKSHFLGEV